MTNYHAKLWINSVLKTVLIQISWLHTGLHSTCEDMKIRPEYFYLLICRISFSRFRVGGGGGGKSAETLICQKALPPSTLSMS